MRIAANQIVATITFLLVLLFTYTAVNKLLDIKGFEFVVSRSPLLKNVATGIAWGVPIFELLVVALLVIPSMRALGLLVATGLMAAFSIYVGYMLATSSRLPCFCGGIINKLNWQEHLVVNIGFTISAFFAWGIQTNFFTPFQQPKNRERITS